jgi:succinate dehydrogenase assembly factor 2
MPQPLDRTGEKTETMRARLVYQARKRGMLEGDLLLATFARDNLASMDHDELKQFDKVCPSLYLDTIWAWG